MGGSFLMIMSIRRLLTVGIVVVLALHERAVGQVELDRFFPVAVQAGQSVALKAEGKFPQWPVKIECDGAASRSLVAKKTGRVPSNGRPWRSGNRLDSFA